MSTMSKEILEPGIRPARVGAETIAREYADLPTPLDADKSLIESMRCYFCHDAPCVRACPTGINIPSFIHKISTGNIKGAAVDILTENIMGGTCARACPTETLCEDACVRNTKEDKPVVIGRLQRFATDTLILKRKEQVFKRGKATGKKVAVVGAGPAGLACAHRLAVLGHEVVVYEAKPKAGGLNEYGLAAYKMTDQWAAKEVEYILGVGGITVEYGKAFGKDVQLADLQKKYSAVFLGVGLGSTNALGLENENVSGVIDAVKAIEEIRQAKDLTKVQVGRNVIVIGGGNTAIDIAVQIKKLGAQNVSLVYRRGEDQMGATWHEREVAKDAGVNVRTWMKPSKIVANGGKVTAMEFEYTTLDAKGSLAGLGTTDTIAADQVFKAIGQKLDTTKLGGMEIAGSKIKVGANYETTVSGVFAGGDCIKSGEDLTVQAVQDGKMAAESIHKFLSR